LTEPGDGLIDQIDSYVTFSSSEVKSLPIQFTSTPAMDSVPSKICFRFVLGRFAGGSMSDGG